MPSMPIRSNRRGRRPGSVPRRLRRQLRWSWPAVALLLAATGLPHAGAGGPGTTPGKGHLKVVFPPEKAVLLSGNFDVITQGPAAGLELDGNALAPDSFGPPIQVAHVGVPPGWHELRVGNRRIDFVVALNEEEHDGPSDWPLYRTHTMEPGPDRCGDCHQTHRQNGRTLVGDLKTYQACLECHEPVDFQVIHSHPLEPLEPCQMCHRMHGSTGHKLLKAPAKKLCAKCHDS